MMFLDFFNKRTSVFRDFIVKIWEVALFKGIACSSLLCPTFQTLYLEAPTLIPLQHLSNGNGNGLGLLPRGPKQCHASLSSIDDLHFLFATLGVFSS